MNLGRSQGHRSPNVAINIRLCSIQRRAVPVPGDASERYFHPSDVFGFSLGQTTKIYKFCPHPHPSLSCSLISVIFMVFLIIYNLCMQVHMYLQIYPVSSYLHILYLFTFSQFGGIYIMISICPPLITDDVNQITSHFLIA